MKWSSKRGWLLGLFVLLSFTTSPRIQAQSFRIQRIATNLQNPRGVAVLPDERLIVAEAGTGYKSDNPEDYTGKISILEDSNNDGDFEEPGEITNIVDKLPGYNMIYQFNPARDEVIGLADILVLDGEQVFFTLDDNFERIIIGELDLNSGEMKALIERPSSLNSIAYDPHAQLIYVAESTLNTLSSVTLEGDLNVICSFDILAHGQQAVPAGVAVDPTTGEILVALFSGQLWDYYDSVLSFMPGDAKVVRVDPQNGRITDEIVELTTAVDIAVDDLGNVYVVEMTTHWPTPTLAHEFDLFDPAAPPDPGGYARFSGRVTLFPVDGTTPVIVADGLDQPTNLTYYEDSLYVSTGQGTPGRSVWGPYGLTQIIGEIYRIDITPK